MIDDSLNHGRVSKRRRTVWAIINLKNLIWTGPADSAAVAEQFAQIFHRFTADTISGSMLFAALDEERNVEYSALARVQKKRLAPDEVNTIDTEKLKTMILPPGILSILKEWQEFHQDAYPRMNGTIVVDINQHPGSRGASRASSNWPVLLTGSCLAMIGPRSFDWKVATSLEHLSSFGFHVHEPFCSSTFPRTPVADILRAKFQRRQVISLCGNAMDLICQTAWMMYILANVARRPSDTVHAPIGDAALGDEFDSDDI